jgi:hypothetical protein
MSVSSGRPCLPRGRGFTRGRVFTIRGSGKNRVCVDVASPRAWARVDPRPCGHGADAGPHDRGSTWTRARADVARTRVPVTAWTRVARPRVRADAVKRPRGPMALGGQKLGFPL